MQQIPIFDTNVFDHVERGLISQADWKNLLRHRPNRGWPLSNVTGLELMAGVDAAKAEGFLDMKQRIARAYSLSNGRILEDPRALLCKEVLHIPFPPDYLAPSSAMISRYMDIIRRANLLDQLLDAAVPYKGGRAGFDTTSVFSEVMVSPKEQWKAAVERMADETHADWREEEKMTGKRRPFEKRRELKQPVFWLRQRTSFINALFDWLHATADPAAVTEMSQRLDAVLEFTVSVTREFLLGDYSLEDHESDVFDQFQLQYLAIDKFVIVTSDRRVVSRTRQSRQAARIMSFDQFLQSLE